MTIDQPKLDIGHPDYAHSCEEAIDDPVRRLIDAAIQAGWEPRTVYQALQEVGRHQAIAYEEDPDPAGT